MLSSNVDSKAIGTETGTEEDELSRYSVASRLQPFAVPLRLVRSHLFPVSQDSAG